MGLKSMLKPPHFARLAQWERKVMYYHTLPEQNKREHTEVADHGIVKKYTEWGDTSGLFSNIGSYIQWRSDGLNDLSCQVYTPDTSSCNS